MFDNGLLKFYNNTINSKGYLNASTLGITHNVTGSKRKVEKAIIDGEKYYLKSVTKTPPIVKHNTDAEVLLSQLYCKFGIDSTIYLPAENSYGKFLICDDVASPNVVPAVSHLYPYLSGSEVHSLPILAPPEKLSVDLSQVFTKNAMMEQTKMRILDTASFNSDRHYLNFFYRLQHTPEQFEEQIGEDKSSDVMQYFRNLMPNRAKEVVSIDYEICGGVLSRLAQGNKEADCFNEYENDFGFASLTRQEMLKEIKTNEQLATLVDKEELAEQIGSLDPISVADDIKQTIGYEVDSKVVDVLAKSYDEMAETLLQ